MSEKLLPLPTFAVDHFRFRIVFSFFFKKKIARVKISRICSPSVPCFTSYGQFRISIVKCNVQTNKSAKHVPNITKYSFSWIVLTGGETKTFLLALIRCRVVLYISGQTKVTFCQGEGKWSIMIHHAQVQLYIDHDLVVLFCYLVILIRATNHVVRLVVPCTLLLTFECF